MTAVAEERPVVFAEPSNKLVRVTPEIATEYLSRSDLNRRLSRDRAIALAEAFKRGEHRLTGDAIVFSRYGLMTNGQHRMLAVVIAGNPDGYEFWVMEGAEDDEQMVQDTGRSRSFTDNLRIRGVANAQMISSVLKMLWHYEVGTLKEGKAWRARVSPTVLQLDAYLTGKAQYNGREVTREEVIRDGVRHADRVRHKIPLSSTVLSLAWIIINNIDETDAAGFWDELSMKDSPSEPVKMLISLVLKQSTRRQAGKSTGWYNTFDARHQLALVLKTWNSYRSGNVPGNLIFRSGGVAPEAFPVAK